MVASQRDTVIIEGAAPGCASCTLEVMPPIRLGTSGDADIPQRVPLVLRDRRGNHFLIFNGWSDMPILRYDSAGRHVGRLGGLGNGPGEYTMTSRVLLGPADSVLVFFGPKGQLFGPDGVVVRTIRTPGYTVFGVAPDGSGGMYAAGASSFETIDAAPYVTRLAADGTPLDSFPIFSAVVGTGLLKSGRRQRTSTIRMNGSPTVAPDGSIWTLTQGNYRIERHDAYGKSRQLLGVTAPDLPPPRLTVAEAESVAALTKRPTPPRRLPTNAPRPITPSQTRSTLTVDTTGLLWVVRTIPAPRGIPSR